MARLTSTKSTKKRYPSKRERIDHFVAALKKGTEFSAQQVSKKFDLSNGEQAAGYLWPRGDVKNIAHGRWMKI